MSKKLILLIVLTVIFLASCGGNLDSPPLVYLVADGDLVDGFQSSYCWDQGVGATICVDTIEPYFDETTHLPANAPIRFQFDTPLPNEVKISISEELFGETIFSESLSPAEIIDWSPAVPPGEYVIDIHVSWKQGAVAYWFSIVIE
ncbi:MAG: hypothetical protein ISR59_02800 [Anaerolineales bacterium]|uniref:Uncharacterized protein n=1 Tax=Candidatus Desulfolinea nitratireducens TaxID=2841698 RepID=A0A8J6TH97_9CHLR|nr:hypothetical protein [Candidatus Desulfolinea nitratireducens]MBL6960011.1 hypothetical protein [Anaerolineales bacterium]